jgi:cell wall-associated NlpC family hydrolase
MVRRSLLTAALAAAVALIPAAAAAKAPTLAGWDKPQQRQVVTAGLMQNRSDGYDGAQPLSSADLGAAFTALSTRTGTTAVSVSSAPITVTRFDALLVYQLGLSQAASTFQSQAENAGLNPPSYFGTEVVARLLSLRYNHESPYDNLDLYPWQQITRAEAAWSFAQVLHFGGWQQGYANEVASRFVLPRYNAKQRAVLSLAVSKIGMPYVWGGETDGPSPGQMHGGYDCSGFVWRVYKRSGNPAGLKIGGRTAAQQAGEIPRSKRLRLSQVRPGDLLFFGSARFHSRATEANVIHEGLALSKDFAIHSSDQGVYVLPLYEGWLHDQFTWARRVL